MIAVLAAGLLLRAWLACEAAAKLTIRHAAEAGSLAEAAATRLVRETDLLGCFRRFPDVPAGQMGSQWPGFRGAARDNVARDAGPLAETWPEEGPRVIWQIAVGDGHAMPALIGGNLYLLDYDEARGGDVLRCINADTGQTRWEHFYAVRVKRNHGISRTVVATDGEVVVSIGPKCHVLALSAVDGRYLWGFSLPQRFGAQVPLWYAGQCPLIDGDLVILAPAGPEVLLCGVDLRTGETVFQTPNPGGLRMSHSSVMLLNVEGMRHYVYAALGGIVGVAADGDERGTLLWRTDVFQSTVIAPSPVPIDDNGRFFMTAGYGAGGVMFQVMRDEAGAWRVEELFRTTRRQFASEQQTPILLGDLLYTVLPSDGGGDRLQLICMTTSGERLWTSGPEDTFGLGPYVATADGLMILMNNVGTITLARVSRDGYQRLARHALMDNKGRDAWGPMLLADGRLYLRDSTRLYCLDVSRPE